MKGEFTTVLGSRHGGKFATTLRLTLTRAMLGRLLLAVLLVCMAQSSARACFYHDPETVRVGMLNWFYPNSLHVTGAIWRAQQEGRLPPPDTTRITARGKHLELLNAMAYRNAVQAIRAFGERFAALTPEGKKEQFSLVLVETALWTRFTITGEHSLTAVDIGSPGEGDLVMVTGEPVVYAILRSDLTLSAAISSGMVKLYGEQKQIDHFVNTFGQIGNLPLNGKGGKKP